MNLKLLLIALTGYWLMSCQSSQKSPLKISTINPRYFTNDSGKAIYLTGSHTWNNLMDMNSVGKADTFDFGAYLDFMDSYHLNFARLWTWELLNWDTANNMDTDPLNFRVSPHPWLRTGPGNAVDGQPKFDLHRFNPAYFDRLRQRVKEANDRNIYLSVMLFEGWGLQFSPGSFKAHPFHPSNTITDLGLDTTKQEYAVKIHELGNDNVLAVQEAYVKKVIETVNEYPNVLYEISNENHPPSTPWQYHMIRLIKDYEKDMTYQHPVGMTFQYKGGSNQTLFDSPADWISPNPEGGYRDQPPVADGTKVLITDTDHLWGTGGIRQWVWESFLQGMNPIFMDPYRDRILSHDAEKLHPEDLRKNMGYTMEYANKMDLIHMLPQPTLSSSGYCLAQEGQEYLVYLPDTTQVAVDLSAATGIFQVEWLDPTTGEKKAGDPVEGGEKVSFTTPFSAEDAVLYLKADD